MDIKVRGVYLDGRRLELEKGEPFRGSDAAQENVAKILLKIAQRIEAEEKDEHSKAG